MSKNLEKLKQFFRSNRATSGQDRVQVLTAEIERELRKDNLVEKRMKILKELGDIGAAAKLEEFAVEKLWDLTKDMLEPQKPAEVREAAFIFYTKLIQGQYRDLGMMRGRFFILVQEHNTPDDLMHCLEMLRILTDNGKDIQNFEVEIAKFMYKWMDQIIAAQLTASYLALLVNLIKYNTSSFDSHIINGIVQRVCNDICSKFIDDRDTFLQCLFVIETVICYCVFPDEILKPCIYVLCLAVNFEMYVETSYKIMRNLLGTQFGYSSLLKMCSMLKEGKNVVDPYILRGVIFHTNMNLWGGTNSSLQNGIKFSSVVLSSYLEVLQTCSLIVTYEVILSLQTLINKCGTDLSEPSWDIVVEILKQILSNIEKEKEIGDNVDLINRFHAIFDTLENMIQNCSVLNINEDKIYSVIEKISSKRPEASIIKLVNHKAMKINVMTSGWLKELQTFMERFFRQEKTQSIRLSAIEHLKEIINLNRACYEEEILEKVVIVIFSDIAQEQDVKIRVAVCRLLLEICSHCDTKRCLELLDILEKNMNRPFDLYALDSTPQKNEHEFEDSITVVNGLIDLFLEKLHQLPSSHAIKIYQILIAHLEAHYHNVKVFEHATKIRYSIINWMLRVRANAAFFVGYPSPRLISDNIKYSHYLAIEGEFQHPPQTPNIQEDTKDDKSENIFTFSHPHVTTLSIKRGCKIIVKCLDLEKDWHTVQLVLRELPKIMQNKTLIQGNDVDILAKSLSDLFRISYDKEQLIERFTLSNEQKDFRGLVIPAIASLITYNAFLSIPTKKKIVEILKSEVRMDGSLSICVQAFTILLMERCDIFERQLADIVLSISKVSDTMHVAIPILEFMSTITHLPYSFTNLNQKQFSYVFATCLPYTSPARYDHYVVSLAHHIIASWFLKARLQWRKGYADYIIEGIAKNIDKSIQDSKQLQRQLQQEDTNKGFHLLNEDSSLRKRSSSLTEQSNRRKEINNPQIMKMKAQRAALQTLSSKDFDMHGFHIELIETCIDFMTRHTYSLSLALPRRMPSANYLLRGGGQSKTWIVGHAVITIVTNACIDNHEWANCSCYCSDWAEIIVRRPTGQLSWLMKFQNQVGLFANEFSFHDLKGLFSDYELDPENPNGILVRRKNEANDSDGLTVAISDELTKIPLQSTASDSAVFSFVTQPIDIPAAKSEPDHGVAEDDISYDDDDSDDPKRNPVRRVNSSPEMRSNWKHNMGNKSNPSRDKSTSNSTVADEQEPPAEGEVQQKKKSSYSKETKVSCEAIPEEISTLVQKEELSLTINTAHRPVQLLSSISAQEPANVATIPKKQHSADDTIHQLRRVEPLNTNMQRNQDWSASVGASNLPLSPRYYKAAISRQVSHQVPLESDDSGYRARSKTISVIGRNKEVYENQSKTSDFSVSTSSIEQTQQPVATSGIQPSFVFVQLFNTGKMDMGFDKPLPVSDKYMGTLNLLDFIPPYEIHKIGVIYVKQGQANNETEILRNVNGSLRYTQFLHNLGSLIAIKDAKEKNLFVNMEPKREGNYTYVWHDDIIQMTFHVATLMPTLDSDPNCNEKKKYIGNDFATIVYNESGEDYNLNTIKGQFNYACIIVQPLEMGSNLVTVRAKGDIEEYFKHHEPKIVSDRGAPLLARQLALHANMASLVSASLKNPKTSPYANNWLERLRKIKLLKNRIAKDTDQTIPTMTASTTTTFLKDVFTKYT